MKTQGIPLAPEDYAISADYKTRIQAQHGKAIVKCPIPHKTRCMEAEYEGKGALAHLVACDVRRGKLFEICERKSGIQAYHKLVDLVMGQAPRLSARRVFRITDKGSSHRAESLMQRLLNWHPNAIQIPTPAHASWLNLRKR